MLNQIWTDETYVYAATTSGLDVIDIETEQRASFATSATGYTTVWASSDQVFLGSSAGVKVLNKSSIGPVEISSAVYNYQNAPLLPDDNVNYIHGNSNKLICCTVDGVAIIRRDSGYVTKTTISGANKCFVTPEHDYYYYTVSGVGGWQLNRLNGNYSDWVTPDVTYTTGSGFLEDTISIADFYVTEHTSVSGVNNTLFIATDVGIYVYDEDSQEYVIFATLAGTSTNYKAVWADPSASINNAKMYAATTGSGSAFSVIDLQHRVLVDSYSTTNQGINEEYLEREDIVDINVNTAGA